jgi:predicted ATP-grasp superfamily ATP-dependent carboligase
LRISDFGLRIETDKSAIRNPQSEIPSMHVFLYEWATGGGLIDVPRGWPASLVREGSAMLGALAADFTRIDGCRVSVLRDVRVLELALPGCEIVDVISDAAHHDEFDRLAGAADATILIAPEFDRILWKAARHVVAAGGRLASPSPDFIRIATDKQRTCELLATAGIRVPAGFVLQPEEPLPANFTYPAVMKPNDGAGSQDAYLVSGPHDAVPAYAWPRRLEPFIPGMAASVAFLCGATGRTPLVPCRQRLSNDGRFRYLGGELPLAAGLAERAVRLAGVALAAMPSATGHVGVDLVLGRDPNGSEDAVIEINPRLTTSYVGLRSATGINLAEAMMRKVRGEDIVVTLDSRPLEFDAEGNVSFIPDR